MGEPMTEEETKNFKVNNNNDLFTSQGVEHLDRKLLSRFVACNNSL